MTENPLIKILKVHKLSKKSELLVDFRIDSPKQGEAIDTYSISIIGWAIGKKSPAVAVELLSDGKVLKKVPIGKPRPRVQKLYPEIPEAKNSGFTTALGLIGLPLKSKLIIEVLLKDKTRVRIAEVQFRRLRKLNSNYKPHLQPLVLTALGRSGTTWLMQLLSEHSDMIVAGNYPYEILAAQYWIHLLKVISEPANRLESTPKFHYFAKELNWVGHHPFYDTFNDAQTFSWFGKNYAEELTTFCQKSIDEFYQQVAHTKGKPDLADKSANSYFVEKYHANFPHILEILSEIYSGYREIFLVRDFRDVVCSNMAWRKKRNPRFFEGKQSKTTEDYVQDFCQNAVPPLLERWQQHSSHACLVRYEDLILSPEATLTRIFEYLGLDSSEGAIANIIEKASENSHYTQRHQTSSSPKDSIERWRQDLEPSLQKVCNRVLAKTLREFGYSPD